MRIGVLICLLYDMAVWMLSGWGRGRLFDGYAAWEERGKPGGRKPKQNQTDNQTDQLTDNQTNPLPENQTGQLAENQRDNLELE